MVPAHSSASFQLIASAITWQGWLVMRFNDETGKQVGYAQKGIWMFYPSANITATMDKATYVKGETVNLTLNLQNKQSASYTTTMMLRITDPANASVYTTTLDIALPASGASTRSVSFALPRSAQAGFYIVTAEAYDTSGKKIGGASTSFEVPKSQVIVKPNLPSALTMGANTISFVMSNTGKVNVSSGMLSITLKGPDGAVAYSGLQPFTLAAGENKTIDVSVSIPFSKFGSYSLILAI